MNNKEFYELLVERGGNVRSYSGRGMFGKQCLALCIEYYFQNIFGFIAECVAIIDDESERLDVAKIFSQTRSDSLGRGSVYYWPDIAWDEETMQATDD